MNTEYVKIIDFILTELNKKAQYEGDSIDELLYKYEKETGLKQDNLLWEKIAQICESEYLIEKIGDSFMYEISPNGIKLLLKHGSYLNYIKSQSEYFKSQEEIENLNKKVSELSITNLTLQNRQLRTKWIFSIIGFILGAIVTHLKDILIILKIIPQQ